MRRNTGQERERGTGQEGEKGTGQQQQQGQGQQRGMSVNPIQMQKYLKGLKYPVEKNQIVEQAQSNGAPEDVMSALQQLPEQTYNRPTDVTKAVSALNKK